MNKFISFMKRFAFGDDECDDKGYIHIIMPRGEMEFKANFGDKDSIEGALNIIIKEKELRFEKKEYL